MVLNDDFSAQDRNGDLKLLALELLDLRNLSVFLKIICGLKNEMATQNIRQQNFHSLKG
jgi:hypothetical protein